MIAAFLALAFGMWLTGAMLLGVMAAIQSAMASRRLPLAWGFYLAHLAAPALQAALLFLGVRTGARWLFLLVTRNSPITEVWARGAMERAFVQKAGFQRVPEARWLDNPRPGTLNALMIGESLWISRNLAWRLAPGELEAVFLHEAAHARLGHLRERSAWMLLLLLVLSIPWRLVVERLLGISTPAALLPFLLFLGVAAVMRAVIRRQELEADEWAVARGASPTALGHALELLSKVNHQDPEKRPRLWWLNPAAGHPTCAERCRRLAFGARAVAESFDRYRLVPAHALGAIALGVALVSPLLVQGVFGPELARRLIVRDDLAALARLEREGIRLSGILETLQGAAPSGSKPSAGRAPASTAEPPMRGSLFTRQWLEGRSGETPPRLPEAK